MARASLSRSNGSRLPSFLTTVRSRSWTRSNVVKRAPQASHWRRRRIAAPSSDGRLSFTWLSSWAQKGHRISDWASAIDREARAKLAHASVHLALDRGIALGSVLRKAIEHVRDHVADVAELGFAKPAGRARRRAD